MDQLLSRVTKQSGQTKSDVIRQALKRQLTIKAFQQIRKKILPFAESQGLLTDEDVFGEVS